MRKNCSKFTIHYKTIIRFGLIVFFIRKFAAATKNLKTNYSFFNKPACYLLIQKTRRSMTNF